MITRNQIIGDSSILDSYKSRSEVEVQCDNCKLAFKKTKHQLRIALINKGNKTLCCSRECSLSLRRAPLLCCKQCNKEYPGYIDKRSITGNTFCSQSCAATHNNLLRKKAKEQQAVIRAKPIANAVCLECKTTFTKRFHKEERKYCSNSCHRLFEYKRRKKDLIDGFYTGRHIQFKSGGWQRKALSELKGYKCAACQIANTYNSKPITLEVNHIDGVATNNTVENLEFLCPNCHSQTKNYKNNGGRTSTRSYRSKYHIERMRRRSTN